ncbi:MULTISPECIES: CPBP family intramembrane glutamic endopeptidase [Enterococcus]|uniref:CAAX prenyl protease 2/Lysostaphin resistance protein A-like domain-containing protein n=1 Tax=Enterococcus malodoratus ATCC 43197 TaxID=1158601 RepID=R2RGL8_9ENTE|nr:MULTISPECIES: CPBP family intramembrane glutamic endopeptidase [Enterococcus]EOH75134.1 hypothetical protein UAI_02936 [Enterococcus malodoratus ATCC 43197]EOT66596.1 hypothetical protein I585_02117 [Enterococcus malodoratus ATCC 43197]SPW90618.1 CAAX amino terminal protease self- immunity [Enterococcus malodoratus]STD70151.1 CAAX amino terminal protease self- immunity [Enterococcus malodoratus]HCM87198.1 CPBP family intramembrane metalloprotease [Enterococcus sp.]
MKNQTVEKLWNVMICLGLGGLVLLFSVLFSMFLWAAQGNNSHNCSVIEIFAMCFFSLFASFVMLRLSESLKLFSFDLKFFSKKNGRILFLCTLLMLTLLFAEIVLMNQHLISDKTMNPLAAQVFTNVPPLIMVLFSFVFAPIMEEVVFRGGIIGLVFNDHLLLGVCMSSLIYCLLVRPENIFDWLLCFATNAVLGISYAKTKRLEVPIIIKMIAVLFIALSI